MKILAVVNPISGGKEKTEFLEELKEVSLTENHFLKIFYTTGEKDDSNLLKAIRDTQPDRILAVGGDGTMLLVARNLIHRNIPLCVIPMGSANGMATELGVPSDPSKALEVALKSGKLMALDMLLFNGRYYGMHISDIGLNARLVEGFENDSERGMLTYAKHFVRVLESSKILSYEVLADGREYKLEGYMLAFANAQKYGTGVVLNPVGRLSDGKFELINLKSKSWDVMLRAGLSVFSTSLNRGDSDVDVISCKRALVKLPYETILQIDGEVMGRYKQITVEMVTKAVDIVLPDS